MMTWYKQNGQRTREEMEYELLDTGIFNEDRYFDVFIEYAKAGPEDILVKITAINRGPEAAKLHLLPTLWFRNDWSAWIAESNRANEKPNLRQIKTPAGVSCCHPQLIQSWVNLYFPAKVMYHCYSPKTKQTTNGFFPGQKNESPYVKDGINDFVVHGNQNAVNPEKQGTKVAAHFQLDIGAGQTSVIRLRLYQKYFRT